ncbi:Bug family tripartite tricarboxylate transporter substrate binding protein [Rhodoferax sp.]|uniref:Bug family tripartite tricarboxylate transporter substrate binding protein n=1 Tax=Rhodoferax sp. TaxID=50421 RepID=UPI00374D9CEE
MFASLPTRVASRRSLLTAVALAAAACLPAIAQAQAYPNKPVTLIVPYPAGGANDAVGRLIGQKLADTLGQPVVVDNRPGAGTTIGAALAARAPADGYTIVLGSLASNAVSPHLIANPGYDAMKDFAPIGLIGVAPMVATVNKESPYTTLKSLVDDAKKRPGDVMYGSAGNGSPLHLAGELFSQAAGVNMTHVPYKGGNAHTMDLIGGRLSVIFDTTTGAMPMIKGDKIRAIAVSSPTRLPDLPNVPTFAEAGYPNFEVSGWYALYAPAKTPPDIVARLSADLGKIMQMPDVDSKLKALAVKPAYGTPQELASFTQSEFIKYGKVIKVANIKAD